MASKKDEKSKVKSPASKVKAKDQVEVKPEKVIVKSEKTEAVKVEQVKKEVPGLPSLKELLEAGAHFGHIIRRWNPKMKPYIYAPKNGIHIIDLFQTREQLNKASLFVENSLKDGKKILVVGTKGQASELVRTKALELGIPYITTRWVGGLFTNWEQIKSRVAKLVEMKAKFEAGEYKKYTKKEQVDLKKMSDRLERMYGGLVSLDSLPDIILIVDPMSEVTAVAEAKAKKITIVAIADTNCDPTGIAHLIPANDDALKSITLIMTTLFSAMERGMKAAKSLGK